MVLALFASLTLDYERGFQLRVAKAQTANILPISWTPPTQYTDGFPLLEQDLDFYTFYCNGAVVKQIDSIIGTPSDNVDISDLGSGDYTCHLTTTSLLAVESGSSNSINFTIVARVPGSPVGLTTS